ncbi:MAG: hypothetical protein QOJ47_1146 [Gaiellales bacterium]|jgi:uncharacterized protein with FMN-binding domain|nr:hypothetical protein [Gaiellales bacterium]MDX6579597.1 hypothetical protein [Gaiellales bacterium]
MHRPLAAALTLAFAALPSTAALAAPATSLAQTSVVTKRVKGTVQQADRWGTVQVVLVVTKTTNGSKVTRKIKDLTGSYTYHTDRSQFIMSRSLPTLRSEALQAKSAKINMVSGATYTSEAFTQSLQAALLQMKKA